MTSESGINTVERCGELLSTSVDYSGLERQTTNINRWCNLLTTAVTEWGRVPPTQAQDQHRQAHLGSQLSECVFGLWNDKRHRKASDRKPEHKSVSTKHHTHRADRFSLLAQRHWYLLIKHCHLVLEPLVTLCNYSSFNEAQTPVPVYCLILQTNTNTKQTQNLPLYQFPCSTKVRLKNSRQRENNQIGPFKERMEEHVSCSVGGFWYLAFRSLLKFFCFHGSLETRNYYFYPRGSESLYTIRNSKMETDKFLSSIFTRCTAQHKKEHFLCAAIVILHWQLRSQEILHSDKCRKTNQVESAHTYNWM